MFKIREHFKKYWFVKNSSVSKKEKKPICLSLLCAPNNQSPTIVNARINYVSENNAEETAIIIDFEYYFFVRSGKS